MIYNHCYRKPNPRSWQKNSQFSWLNPQKTPVIPRTQILSETAHNHKSSRYKWVLKVAIALSFIGIAGCESTSFDDHEQVTWYAVNSASAMRVVIYDLVCERRMGNVRLTRRGETPITTCANSEGRAEVRYRNDVYANQSAGWTTRTNIRPNQRVYVQ